MNRIEFLKLTEQRLIRRRDGLRRALAGDMSLLHGQNGHEGGDEIDAAIATEQSELRSQMASFESRELAQVESALGKLRAGDYGRCETCERPINPLRLKALPYATECIGCARRDERRSASATGRPLTNRIAAYDVDDTDESADAAVEEIG